jgi:hypothetical protein
LQPGTRLLAALAAGRRRAVAGHAGGRIATARAAAVAARKRQRQRERCRQDQDPIATPHQRVEVVELGDELVAPPLESELLDGEVLLPELDPVLPELEPLPLVPGPPIELVLPLLLGDEPLLAVSLLLEPLLLGLVLAVLGLVGDDLLLLLDDAPGPPAAPVVASRLLQALSERAATTARVAVAHWVRDIFIGNS